MLLSMVVASSFGFPCIISLYKNAIVYLPSPTIGHQSFKGCLTSPSCCVVVRCNYFFLLAVQCAGSSLLCSGFLYAALCLVTQSCLTLCGPMGCSLPGSSVHGILQARILEWVAMSSSRGSPQLRDRTRLSSVSCIGRQFLHC